MIAACVEQKRCKFELIRQHGDRAIGVAAVSLGDFDLDARSDQPVAPVRLPAIRDCLWEPATDRFGKSASFTLGNESQHFGFGEFAFGEQELDQRGALCVEEFAEPLVLRHRALFREFIQ